jgi:hypothetical protein
MDRPRARASALAFLLLAGLAPVGCYESPPEIDTEDFFLQMAEASCEYEVDSCDTPNHADMETCVMEREQELRDLHDEITADDDRTFDGGCANAVVAAVTSEADPTACTAGCVVYPGDKVEGDACTVDEAGSDCAQGLACTDRGVCVAYLDYYAIPMGEPCRDFEGSLGTCAPGFACAGGNTCVTEPATGETCLSGASGTPTVCGVGQYCEPMMRVCLELKVDGDACLDVDECRSGICTNGMCGTDMCVPPSTVATCY